LEEPVQKIKCPHCGYVGYVDSGDVEQCASCGEMFDVYYYMNDDDYERRQDLEGE
jgi:DNA-directed RNA polymerase subunit RPC12/RpoP